MTTTAKATVNQFYSSTPGLSSAPGVPDTSKSGAKSTNMVPTTTPTTTPTTMPSTYDTTGTAADPQSVQDLLASAFGRVTHSRVTLKIADLHVDHPIQRNLNRRRANQMYTIIGGFNAALAGALDVSKRSDGTYWVMDGQHRLAVAEMAEAKSVDCEVYVGLTRDEENLFFRLKNDFRLRVRSSALEMWWSAYEGHDAATLEQAAILASYGFEISHEHRGALTKTNPNLIMAVQAVKDIYTRGGAEWLRRTLGFIRDAFPGDPDAVRQEILLGSFDFLREFWDQVRYQELLYKLRHMTATTLIAEANMITEYSSRRLRVAEYLRRTYNKGRRSDAGRMLMRRERFNARFSSKAFEQGLGDQEYQQEYQDTDLTLDQGLATGAATGGAKRTTEQTPC